MQTFLPCASFRRSAAAIDRVRLGKQRVETLQLMKALTLPEYGWKNHPATKMWAGYEPALLEYQRAVCHEWTQVRGYKDTCLEKTIAVAGTLADDPVEMPPWLGDEDFHRAHRSNLVRKDPDHYRAYFPDVPDDLEYIWPAAEFISLA